MDSINVIRDVLKENEDLDALFYDICDMEFPDAPRLPKDEDGRLAYSIAGKAFARDTSGGEYILLADGSVGYCSRDGECGRMADSVPVFLEFMLNCPFWMDYRGRTPYEEGDDALRAFAAEQFEEHAEMAQEELDLDLREAQEALAKALNIQLHEDITQPVLMKFYQSANRDPKFSTTFTEQDGTKRQGKGTLI